jgi:antitoxin ParD1/3/4
MNVSLTPELESVVQSRVQSGRYNSASEVVREALRLLEQHDALRTVHLRELRSRMDQGLASLSRGEGVDGEKYMTQMLNDLDSREPKRKAPKRKSR